MIIYQANRFNVQVATHLEGYSKGDLIIELLDERGEVCFLAGEIHRLFKTPTYTTVKMSKTLNIREF